MNGVSHIENIIQIVLSLQADMYNLYNVFCMAELLLICGIGGQKMVYQKEVSKVLEECKSSVNGLTKEQVKEHREIYGENALAEKKNDSPLVIFLKQFKDLLVIILIIAAVISGLNKQLESAIVIVVVITLNAILGTVQTLKAQKSLDSLKKLSVPKVKVMRDGQLTEIDSTELTVGDIVQIEAGDIVSGDGRIIQ